MNRIALLSTVSMLLCMTANAQNIEQVYTSDGSVYEGYISEQIPGSRISVYAEKATLVFPTDSIKDQQVNLRKFSSLGEPARKWLRENADTNNVLLSSFECRGMYYDDVKIIQRGKDRTTAVCLTPKTYRLDWKDVTKTNKTVNADIPYGFRDVLTLITGERLNGQITEQVIGGTVTIRDENGDMHTVNVEDILSTRAEQIDNGTPAWAQAILLDRVLLKNGDEFSGLVSSRVMGKKIVILTYPEEKERSVNMNEIARYQKYPNSEYREYCAPAADTTRSVKLNGTEVELSDVICDGKYSYAVGPDRLSIEEGETVRVEMKNIPCGKTASLFKAKNIKFKSKSKIEYNGKEYPAYKFSDWATVECGISTDENGISTTEITIREEGLYILTSGDESKGIIIEAK